MSSTDENRTSALPSRDKIRQEMIESRYGMNPEEKRKHAIDTYFSILRSAQRMTNWSTIVDVRLETKNHAHIRVRLEVAKRLMNEIDPAYWAIYTEWQKLPIDSDIRCPK